MIWVETTGTIEAENIRAPRYLLVVHDAWSDLWRLVPRRALDTQRPFVEGLS